MKNQENEMSPEEKSVTLARLVGWRCELGGYADNRGWCWVDENGEKISGLLPEPTASQMTPQEIELCIAPTLYEPARMALAWRVVQYFSGLTIMSDRRAFAASEFHDWFAKNVHRFLWSGVSEEDVQADWLDKILELAIEAGMVVLQSEEVL